MLQRVDNNIGFYYFYKMINNDNKFLTRPLIPQSYKSHAVFRQTRMPHAHFFYSYLLAFNNFRWKTDKIFLFQPAIEHEPFDFLPQHEVYLFQSNKIHQNL